MNVKTLFARSVHPVRQFHTPQSHPRRQKHGNRNSCLRRLHSAAPARTQIGSRRERVVQPGAQGQAKAERSMCNWDEDAVTMAVEAARDCLSGLPRDQIRAVQLASTSFPFEDRLNSGIVAQALNLGAEISALDVGSTQRAATAGLAAALEGAASTNAQALFSHRRNAAPRWGARSR